MFDLSGLYLFGALVVMYLIGAFTSQWVMDKIKGVPSTLRAALSAAESNALAELGKAREALVADVAGIFTKKTVVAPVVPAAPAPTAVVAVVPPAASVAPVAVAPAADVTVSAPATVVVEPAATLGISGVK